MEKFIPGQRWISNTESELGLGLILDVKFNRVTVLYLASDERRTYALDNAPLTRVRFSTGDVIESTNEVKITVTDVIENEGLIVYQGLTAEEDSVSLSEMELNHHIQFNKPQDRLFNGQIDPSNWFSLRFETWRRFRQHQQSPVKGLLGGRTALIPHQLYIAHEAANRLAPRIMLADEVGLGKTIEAGLIIHHRLINELSQRVLIIVPETLLHQWLVEMLRRFNLKFSIFNEERCHEDWVDNGLEDPAATLENQDNPFLQEQLVLCSQEFFTHYPQRQLQALEASWDLVVVDEAHHLSWSELAPSTEYVFVEQLGQESPGLILLTATPEQLGKESHFARLRLLDPDRFYSFSRFLEEEQLFEPVAEAAKVLLANQPLDEQAKANLTQLLNQDNVGNLLTNLDNPDKAPAAGQELIGLLLDHHGTGRILFRNSRQTVQGFPDRERHGYPLQGSETEELKDDARYGWLIAKLKALGSSKALLICRQAQMAIALENVLRSRGGIASAVFHEGLSIIERDRAAAYFADPESSARVLICSEIGSEGRNFQFVHHLILFDLPDNPDLLQQRIGRLDRIGQKHVIQIHVPYLAGSAQEILFRWYDEGLDAFRHNSSAAQPVAESLHDELLAVLASHDQQAFEILLDKTRALREKIEEELHHGRDQLLELNSCRKAEAQRIIEQLSAYEHDGALWPYLEDVFDCYGVDTEFHSPECFIVRPSEHLRLSHFPGLPEDGLTLTIDRQIALAREDMQFVTWEHPMVMAAMDLVLSSDTGNAAISVIKHPKLRAGQFLLECLFVVECSAPAEFQISRFLPHTPVRILIDQNKTDVSDSILHSDLTESGTGFDAGKIFAFINKQRLHITAMIEVAEQRANRDMQALIVDASRTMLTELSQEIKRLVRLSKLNPSIRQEEIEGLKEVAMVCQEQLESSQLRLDAIRFLITS
ncbi:MAG: RNA polymerase-binding ATPase [Methylobacter sp.]|nr:MAG: RNA polymerase-binding ATPase [Methylobacter sp.]